MGGLSSFCVLWLGRHNHPYLLRARRGTNAPALLFRSIGKSSFDKDPVKYETFTNVLTGLKSLNLVWHRKGQTRYCKSEFDPGEYVSTSLPGRASRFWATGKLMQLAELHGISRDNVREHFTSNSQCTPWCSRTTREAGGKRSSKAAGSTSSTRQRAHVSNRSFWNSTRFSRALGSLAVNTTATSAFSTTVPGRKARHLYSVGGPASYQQMQETERGAVERNKN